LNKKFTKNNLFKNLFYKNVKNLNNNIMNTLTIINKINYLEKYYIHYDIYSLNNSVSNKLQPTYKFLLDLDHIINEIKSKSFIDINLFDILESCEKNNKDWDIDYTISKKDITWFNSDKGKFYFLIPLLDNIKCTEEYRLALIFHIDLIGLFELHLEN
jgi:hypothetical protein